MPRPVSQGGTGSAPATRYAGGWLAAVTPGHVAAADPPAADPPVASGNAGTPDQPLRTVRAIRAALSPARAAGLRIGLVPTMGALHDGHLALIARAAGECDVVVVSVFVNPTQFDEPDDLNRYPRREAADAALAGGAGATHIFAPSVAEMYPQGFATTVAVGAVSERLEGAVRGGAHFAGVATVVLKLLNVVGPEAAYFGQKDAQQLAVVRALVRDLDVPVRIVSCPTVREADGLAMSSRNARLSAAERAQAVALHRGLQAATAVAASGAREADELVACARRAMAEFGVVPEYLELVDRETFAPVTALDGQALLAVAARIGGTRLIDNTPIEPSASVNPMQATGKEASPCTV